MNSHGFTVVASAGTQLLEALPVAEGRITSRRILKASGGRIVRLALDAGQILTEHTAAVPILIQILAGEVHIEVAGETLVFDAGGVVHLDARLPHSVTADTAAQLMLTLLDGREEPAGPDTPVDA